MAPKKRAFILYALVVDFATVRRIAITAMFSDDFLMEHVVLKGGNALSIVHGIGTRSSLDLDFSIDTDFRDPDQARDRIFRALRDRFDAVGYVVFDETFERRPAVPREGQPARWGGYSVQFKLVERDRFERMRGDIGAIRRDSLVIGPAQIRTFTIDLSRFEFCNGKTKANLDDYVIYVYSPEMIAVEKLRAICQQMEAYPFNLHRHPRARDFYDIWTVTETCRIDFGEEGIHDLVRSIFAAKDVALNLIGAIPNEREFHRPDWARVEQSVATPIGEFDEYFDYVVRQTTRLETLWVV